MVRDSLFLIFNLDMKKKELKEFLDLKVMQYNQPQFIDSDPIQIPHEFNERKDQEIAGFLTATIAWGNRKMIIQNAKRMMSLMGNNPYDFVMSASESSIDKFVHRTFNVDDLRYFISALRHMYQNHDSLEDLFIAHQSEDSLQMAIHQFKVLFFSLEHPKRVEKHVSDPLKGSAAKRINMFLRWMVRDDGAGVDLGLWKNISPAKLSCPLDVHSGNVARKLGLLRRKQNDAKALDELDINLRKLDPSDPVKYDFALFGLGVFEGF